MPTYEYRCLDCRKPLAIYQRYEEYGRVAVACPHCGSANLQRRIGRVRVARSDESRLDSLSDPSGWGDVDENDPRSMARMMRRMGSGFMVTELLGQGINMVTGDYSRGAVGFWVEGGVLSHPVHEVTIAGNLRDMYRNIVAVGEDVDRRGSVRSGSILLEEMTIAGD